MSSPNVVDFNSAFTNMLATQAARSFEHIEQDNRALGMLGSNTLLNGQFAQLNGAIQTPNPATQMVTKPAA